MEEINIKTSKSAMELDADEEKEIEPNNAVQAAVKPATARRRRLTYSLMSKLTNELEAGNLLRRSIPGRSFAAEYAWHIVTPEGFFTGYVMCKRCNFFTREKNIKYHVTIIHRKSSNNTSPTATAHVTPVTDYRGDTIELNLASTVHAMQSADDSAPSTSSANVASLPIAVRNPPTVRLPNFKYQRNAEIDDMLLQVLREENVPVSFLENEYFKDFVTKLNKTYTLPASRKVEEQRREPCTMSVPYVSASAVPTTQFNPSFRIVQRRQPAILKPTSSRLMGGDSGNSTTASILKPTVVTLSEDPAPPSPVSISKRLPKAAAKRLNKMAASCAASALSVNAPAVVSPTTTTVMLDSPDVASGSNINNSAAAFGYNAAMLASAAVRQKSAMRAAIERVDYVMLAAKCYTLSTADKRIYGQLLCVFAFTPEPYIVGLHKQMKRNGIGYMTNQKRLELFVNSLLSDVGRSRTFSLRMDSSGLSSEFAMLLLEKCSWLIVDADDEKGIEIPFSSSMLLPLMSPLTTPTFNEAAMKMLSEKCAKQPRFRDTMLMVDWAHWTARTGIFAQSNRSYAWAQDTLKLMDGFTWWNGFFSDTTLARLYSTLKMIETATSKIRNSWRLVAQVIHNESKSMDSEELMKVISIRFNRRDRQGRQIVFSPIE